MIDLKAPGAILFFGTMNVMPMMYAKRLRELGQDVRYFVDVGEEDVLCRPESHDPSLYPYPDWITEFVLRAQIFANLAPRLILWLMLRKARRRKEFTTIKAVFLGGFFIAFAPFFGRETEKIHLTFGGDFDSWCDPQQVESMFPGMRPHSIFQFFPEWIAERLLRFVVRRNYQAAKRADVLVYFPRGMNKAGDRLIAEMEEAGVRYVPRYDISFEPFQDIDREFRESGERLVILSPVRFLYRTFREGHLEYSKGNDHIIRGLGLYRAVNPAMDIHFFEKGEDVEHAKRLCDEVGISDLVTWHKPVPFAELLRMYETADICFDQLGAHIIGSGLYALYMGKPLIANASNWGHIGENPVMSAASAEEVFSHLVTLSDPATRADVSKRSRKFAEERLGPDVVIEQLTGATLRR